MVDSKMVTPWAMQPTMSETSIKDYLKVQRERYARRPGKQARSVLLDECAAVTGHERKHLIKVLGGRRPVSGEGDRAESRRGRPSLYGSLVPLIKALWLASEQPCGKRLSSVLREWLPAWEAENGALSADARRLLRRISPAQLDRLLAPHRAISPRRRARDSAGAAIRAQVPLRTGPWEVSGPGWFEIDSVAHCGGSMSGSFWWTVVMTDIATGWTEQQPAWNKGAAATRRAIATMEGQLPFAVRGADSDNGSEFLNHHLLAHWSGRDPAVEVTRSRPYHKNDNAHVEQKNRTHVRELLGEDRLDDPRLAPLLEELHRHWSDLHNHFLPTLKLAGKERHGAKIRKRYEKTARTPARRLLEDGGLDGRARIALLARHSALNPLHLHRRIEALLSEIWTLQHSEGEPLASEEVGAARSGACGSLPAPAGTSAGGPNLLRAS